jgi:hypothetical protein
VDLILKAAPDAIHAKNEAGDLPLDIALRRVGLPKGEVLKGEWSDDPDRDRSLPENDPVIELLKMGKPGEINNLTTAPLTRLLCSCR